MKKNLESGVFYRTADLVSEISQWHVLLCSAHQIPMWRTRVSHHTSDKQLSRHQLGVLQFNSIMIL